MPSETIKKRPIFLQIRLGHQSRGIFTHISQPPNIIGKTLKCPSGNKLKLQVYVKPMLQNTFQYFIYSFIKFSNTNVRENWQNHGEHSFTCFHKNLLSQVCFLMWSPLWKTMSKSVVFMQSDVKKCTKWKGNPINNTCFLFCYKQ